MELFEGKTLLRKNGSELEEVSADEVLKDIPIVALYFSAHWCPPCRLFTPTLAEFYAKMKEKGLAFEVIFVTSDAGDEEMRNYMLECHGDWLGIPHSEESLREQLDEKYEIDGIPTLLILKDGEMVTNSARWDIELKPDECYDIWSTGQAATTETEVDKYLEDTSTKEEEEEAEAEKE